MSCITIYMPGNDWDMDFLEMSLKQGAETIYVYFPDGTCEVITKEKSSC